MALVRVSEPTVTNSQSKQPSNLFHEVSLTSVQSLRTSEWETINPNRTLASHFPLSLHSIMPPYANNRNLIHHCSSNSNDDVRHSSFNRAEPIMFKRYLSFIDERFVQFEDIVIIHECPQQHHQCEEDLWYSPKELNGFQKNANQQGRWLQQQRRSCPLPRGLELQTTQGIQRCLKNRLSAMAVVLELQYTAAQEKENVATAANMDDYHQDLKDLYPSAESCDHSSSEVIIAKAYHEVTRHCQLEALDVGLRDHMETVENQSEVDEEEYLQCHSSSSCLNMPTWIKALLNKRSSQQRCQQGDHLWLL